MELYCKTNDPIYIFNLSKLHKVILKYYADKSLSNKIGNMNIATQILKVISEFPIEINNNIMKHGSYGCVYHPAFLPEKSDPEYKNIIKYIKDTSKYVNKFMKDTNAKKEIKFSEILMKIDPNFKYFLYPLKYIITKTNIPKTYITECETYLKDVKDFVSIYLPYGGIDIDEWIDHNSMFNDIPEHSVIKNMISNMIEGLLLLHKNGIVHFDIKPNNFLITDINIKYIDFGLSHNFKESKSIKLKEGGYELWPFDLILINKVWHGG